MIPSYLEGQNLEVLLPKIKAAAAALTPSYEVLVIDTQTPLDNTPEICRRAEVTCISRRGGNQYGDAIRTGISEAVGQYILCMDADGSHSPAFFEALWHERYGHDIVIGSRYVRGGATDNPVILIWMSYVLNLIFRLIFKLPAKDVTNSFRLYDRNVFTDLKLDSSDFDILEELLIKAITYSPSLRIKEVPITFAKRQKGESKRQLVLFILGYLGTLRKLLRFRAQAKRELKRSSFRD
jgi:dolichol-phosphate mannosyltransferase